MGCKGGKNDGSVILGGHSTYKDGIEVIVVCHKYTLHGFEGADGEYAGRLVYIVPVLRLARATKQNLSWAAQISSASWRLSTSRRAWMMAGCMVHVD
jgi:hypothetical protein